MQVKGQLARPHDQSRGRDWLEAAGALTTSKHPEQEDQGSASAEIGFQRSGQGQDHRTVPAVVQQAVDVSVPAVERGVRLQIALALAASQAAVVPHPACGQ